MKLAVIGANGKAGQLIVQEAVNRGYDVALFILFHRIFVR